MDQGGWEPPVALEYNGLILTRDNQIGICYDVKDDETVYGWLYAYLDDDNKPGYFQYND